MVVVMRVGGAEELLVVVRGGDVLRGASALVLAVLMRARSEEVDRGVGVYEVREEMGVPDSSLDSRRRGSLAVGEVGP